MTERPWYTITLADAKTAEVIIYDRIGEGFFEEGVTAKQFVTDLATITEPSISVRINSPGGSVWDGLAIYQALVRHPSTVTTHIDGLAASIASLIALAGDRVVMADGALFMIHDPYVMAEGSADDMRSAANMLDRITTTLVDAYAGKTGSEPDTIRAAMSAETWYTASEAKAAGFVDQIAGQYALAASLDLTPYGFRNAPNPKGQTMTVEQSTPPVAPPTDYVTAADLAALEAQIAAAAYAAPPAATHPLAGFASLADYSMAVYKGDATPYAAAPDQITSDNPGVMPPNWASGIKNIVTHGRPGITAVGVQPAGPNGLEFNWPYFDGNLSAIVAAQSAQKAALNTVLISFKKGTATLATYGAYSDIAYQLLQRSSPSYLEGHNRVMLASYATITDNVFVDALVAGGTASAVDYDLAADTTGALFRAAVFTASSEVESATGSPASVVLVASNVFAKIGGWELFVPAPYGTQNVPGTATASTLAVSVSGLPVVHDRNLAAGSIVVTNSQAAAWIEDGPQFATAETPSKLGRDVAIYGFGVTAIYNAAGVVKITNLA